jgi:hypothetical protein
LCIGGLHFAFSFSASFQRSLPVAAGGTFSELKMKKDRLIMALGCELVTLAFIVKALAPEAGRTTFFTGLAGGSLCLLWAMLSHFGFAKRAGVLLTLIPAAYIFLTQLVTRLPTRSNPDSVNVAVFTMLLVMFASTVFVLAYLLHASDGELTRRAPESHGRI